MKLIEIIENKTDVTTFSTYSKEKIQQAEAELNVEFAEEYAEYIEKYGIVIFDGHEFTGLCDGKRLDVIRITQEQRKLNPNIAAEWYVIECLDIDNIVIWQNQQGSIYQSAPNGVFTKISNSIVDYIKQDGGVSK